MVIDAKQRLGTAIRETRSEIHRRQLAEESSVVHLRTLVLLKKNLAITKRALRRVQMQNRALRRRLATKCKEYFILQRQLTSMQQATDTIHFLNTSGEMERDM